jgi:sugar O-acyltransferase (sialic acid O-acetyltransferase NeuD family)
MKRVLAAGGNMKDIVIYGASGHGKVIADIIEKSGGRVRAFVDDDESLWDRSFFGLPLWQGMEVLLRRLKGEDAGFSVIVAMGQNEVRRKVVEKLETAGAWFAKAVHPSACVARGVEIGEGSVLMANAAVNPGSRIGKHCIINTAATVDHDCIIGDYVHLSPGAHLGGTVHVGRESWLGVGRRRCYYRRGGGGDS